MPREESCIVGTAIVLMLIGLISFPATGLGNDNGAGCLSQGSWFGYGPEGSAEWIATIQGQSQSSGTVILEDPAIDVTLGGIFPTAVRSTAFRGIWKRTGGNTFIRTVIALAVDKNGATVYIAKMTGTSTLSGDCNTSYIENTAEIFLPTQNPFADEPLFTIPLPGHYGYRVRID